MSGDDTFRVQARFNKVEFADLKEDLDHFAQGSPRAGRIRLLMRLGLAAAKGQLPPVADSISATPLNPFVTPPLSADTAPSALSDIDALASRGFDPAAFSFGKKAS